MLRGLDMAEKRRALGRGLGALIPSAPASGSGRPVDVFFPDQKSGGEGASSVGSTTRDVDAGATHAGSANGQSPALVEGGGPGYQDAPPESGLTPVPGAQFAEIDLELIRPNPKQPRSVFDEDDMAELVHSIREIGVLQPIVVRRIPADQAAEADGKQFELIMGERRWRATLEADLATIPAIIKDTTDDALLRDALLENLHRSQLHPLEEAAAYQQLLDDFGCSHEELAQRIVAEGLSVRNVEELVAIGDGETAPRPRRPRAGGRHPQLDQFTAGLSDHLETRVNIALGQRKGKITVEFASMEDLRRILGIMGFESTP